MAGAFSSAFSSAFDGDGGDSPLPTAPQKGAVGGGLLFARKQLQFIALAGPILIPSVAPTVPDLAAVVAETPVRRRVDLRDTRSTEFGRADTPPPPAPDLVALSQPVVVQRRPIAQGLHSRQVILPPGYPADWYPSADRPMTRRRFLTREGYASPVDRPTVPFNPAQGVAILPQPALRPAARRYYAALSTVPPVGPPSSALIPPGTQSWQGLANQPPHRLPPRQGLWPARQNVDPLPPQAPPEGSWYPCAVLPPDSKTRRPQLEAYAFAPDPIPTPALLPSFWTGLYPDGPFAKPGLRADLQQPFADAPPVIEVIVVSGAWRPEAPALLLRAPYRLPDLFAVPTLTTELGNAYGCITLSDVEVTHPILLALSVESATLLDVTVTYPTLLDVEAC